MAKRKDLETHSQDYGFREYDSQDARFWSVDPLASQYPFYSPYMFAGNNPISFIDLDGLEQDKPRIMKNISIIVPHYKELGAAKKAIGVHGDWYFITATDLPDAYLQLSKYLGKEKVNNIVFDTHGSLGGVMTVSTGSENSRGLGIVPQ